VGSADFVSAFERGVAGVAGFVGVAESADDSFDWAANGAVSDLFATFPL
jgi:hypothetical protein